MITVITDMKTPSFLNAARAGQFWEVGPYLKDYPNIEKAIDPLVKTNTSIDGKIYGIARTRNVARVGLLIRQDWLDSLGLKMPQTMDEIYTVAKAFTEKDPDKNGKNDTYGIGLGSDRFWNGLAFPKSSVKTEAHLKIILSFYNRTKDLVANAAEPFISQTWSEKGGELNKIITDSITKYVMDGNWDEYMKAIDTWQQRGGTKVIEEYTAAYNAVKK
ncbi:Lipoprotein LipO precursor [compost metagenome]